MSWHSKIIAEAEGRYSYSSFSSSMSTSQKWLLATRLWVFEKKQDDDDDSTTDSVGSGVGAPAFEEETSYTHIAGNVG